MPGGAGVAVHRAEGSTLRTASAPILDSGTENATVPAVGHPSRTLPNGMSFESLIRDRISGGIDGRTDSTTPRSTTAVTAGQFRQRLVENRGSEVGLKETTVPEARPLSGSSPAGKSPEGFVSGEPKPDAVGLPSASLPGLSLATIEEREQETGVPASDEVAPAIPENDTQVKKEGLPSSTPAFGARNPAPTQATAKPATIAETPAVIDTPAGQTTVRPFRTTPDNGGSPGVGRWPPVAALPVGSASETDAKPIDLSGFDGQISASFSGPSPIARGPATGDPVVPTDEALGGSSEVPGLKDAAPTPAPERQVSEVAKLTTHAQPLAPAHTAESGASGIKKAAAAGMGRGSASERAGNSDKTKGESTSLPVLQETRDASADFQPKASDPCGGAVAAPAPVAIPQNPAPAVPAAATRIRPDGSVRNQHLAAQASARTGRSEEIQHPAGDHSGKYGSVEGHAGLQKADSSSGVHGEVAAQRPGSSTLQTRSGAGMRTLVAGSSNSRATNSGAAGIASGPAASRGATEELRGMPVKLAAPLSAAGAFERLDSAAAPQTIASTPQRLTVGVQSGGLGWVEVRAHTAQGLVSATLATSSVESQHTVAAQLPAIREALSGAQVQVGDLRSEVFSAPSRNREGSQQDQPQGGGGDSGKTSGQRERPAAASTETEMEALSYINVRV